MSAETITTPVSQSRQRTWDKIKKYGSQVPAYLILGIWSLFTIFIILWVMMSSLKTNNELFKNVWALPTKLHFENYTKALFAVDMEYYFLNSLVVVLTSVLVILILSARPPMF